LADWISLSAFFGVIIRRQQRLHAYLAVQMQRLEQMRSLREVDRFFRFDRHEKVRLGREIRLRES